MSTLQPEQVRQLQLAIDLARRGAATIPQLAAAHELASGAGLAGCASELRHHMIQKLDPSRRNTGRDLLLGMASGALTHYLLRGV